MLNLVASREQHYTASELTNSPQFLWPWIDNVQSLVDMQPNGKFTEVIKFWSWSNHLNEEL